MSLSTAWAEYFANTTKAITSLQPITLPVALQNHPLPPLEALISHLSSTPVHATYYPLIRFGVLHAARVAIIWSKLTKGRKGSPSLLQDLTGYLTLCWGGGTLVSLLLSDSPSWLVSPTPWLVYVPIYLALIPTRLADFAYRTTPALFDVIGALLDGVIRGTTLASIPLLISSSPLGASVASTPTGIAWPVALLGGLMISGGGVLVQTFGLNKTEWTLGVPASLTGSLLDSMDAWASTLTTLLQYYLLAHPSRFAGLPYFPETRSKLVSWLPSASVVDDKIVQSSARAIGVIFLAGLLLSRVVIRWFTQPSVKPVSKAKADLYEEPTSEKSTVVKSPVEIHPAKTTPRKKKAKKEAK